MPATKKLRYEKPVFQTSAKLSQVTAQAVVSGVNMVSDRRLKTDVRPLVRTDAGIQLYAYRYLWSDEVVVGAMAQDLLADPARRAAVSLGPDGFYRVDYHALGLQLRTFEEWQREAGDCAPPHRSKSVH